MLCYVGIDQHRKQLTVSVRDESGNVLVRRQVSTRVAWKVRAFFDEVWKSRQLARRLPGHRRNLRVQSVAAQTAAPNTAAPEGDRRAAWENSPRTRPTAATPAARAKSCAGSTATGWAQGLPIRGLRRIQVPVPPTSRPTGRLTSLRHDVGRELTRSINRLRRPHPAPGNLEQECPTKGIQTQQARKWLDQLPLSAIEQAE